MIRVGLQAGAEVYWLDQSDGWIPLHSSVRGGKRDQGILEMEFVLSGIASPSLLRERLGALRAWERKQRRERVELLIDDSVVVESYPVLSLVVDDTPTRLPFWHRGYATVAIRIRAAAQPRLVSAITQTVADHVTVPSLGTVALDASAAEELEIELEHDPVAVKPPGCYTLALTPLNGVSEIPLTARGDATQGGFLAQAESTEIVAVVRGSPVATLTARITAVPPFDVIRAMQQPAAQELRLGAGEIAVVWAPQALPPGWVSRLGGTAATAEGPAVLTVPSAEALVVLRGLAWVGEISGSATSQAGHQITLPGTGTRLLMGSVGAQGFWTAHGSHVLAVSLPEATPTSTPVRGAAPFWLVSQNTLSMFSADVAVGTGGALIERPEVRIYNWSFLVFAVQNPSTLANGTYLGIVVEEHSGQAWGQSELLQVAVPPQHAIRVEAQSEQGYPVQLYLRPLTSSTWYRTVLSGTTVIRSLGTPAQLPTTTNAEYGVLSAEIGTDVLSFRRSTARFAVGRRQLVSLGILPTEAGTWYKVDASVTTGVIERMWALARPQWMTVAAPGGVAQKLQVQTRHNSARVVILGGLARVEAAGSEMLTHSSGWWTVSARRWTRQALDEWGQGLPGYASGSPPVLPVRDVQWNGEWLRRAAPYPGATTVLGVFSPVPAPRSIRVLVVYRRFAGTQTTITFRLRAVTASGATISEVSSGGLEFDNTVRTATLEITVPTGNVAGYVVDTNRGNDLSYTVLWSESGVGGDMFAGLYNGSSFGTFLRISPPVVPGRHGRVTVSQTVGTVTVAYAFSAAHAGALHGDAERWYAPASGFAHAGLAVEPGQPLTVYLRSSSGGTPAWRWIATNGTSTTTTLTQDVNVFTVPTNAALADYYASPTSSYANFDWFGRGQQVDTVEQIYGIADLRRISLAGTGGSAWAIVIRYAASAGAGGDIVTFATVDGATWQLGLTDASWVVRRNGSTILSVARPSGEQPRTVCVAQTAEGLLSLRVGEPNAWSTAAATTSAYSLHGAVEIVPASILPAVALRWIAVITGPTQQVFDGTLAAFGSNDPAAVWGADLGHAASVYDPLQHPMAIVRGLARPGFARGALTLDGPSTMFVVAQQDLVSRDVVDANVTVTVRRRQ